MNRAHQALQTGKQQEIPRKKGKAGNWASGPCRFTSFPTQGPGRHRGFCVVILATPEEFSVLLSGFFVHYMEPPEQKSREGKMREIILQSIRIKGLGLHLKK